MQAKLKRPSILLFAGALLLGGSLTLGYWWLYKLAPMRHLLDPAWCAQHSEVARWAEEQNDYWRMGSAPDLCFRGDRIGFYGDKFWFLWLEERIRYPRKFRSCGCTEYVLALMTNQHVSNWKDWAEANRGRSQEKWIQDGFMDYGVKIHLPPKPGDIPPLLELLSRKSWNFLWAGPQGTNAPESVPSYIHYNAFRWLRDSGFHPVRFASSNALLTAESKISRGLIRYSQWLAAYPGEGGVGVLSFAKGKSNGNTFEFQSPLSNIWLQLLVYTAIVAFAAVGILLIRFSLRKSKQVPSFDSFFARIPQ